MGVVEAVGPEVKSLKKGDRAVASFEMACGSCVYCKASFFSGCDRTNPRWAPQQQRSASLHRSPASQHGPPAAPGGVGLSLGSHGQAIQHRMLAMPAALNQARQCAPDKGATFITIRPVSACCLCASTFQHGSNSTSTP